MTLDLKAQAQALLARLWRQRGMPLDEADIDDGGVVLAALQQAADGGLEEAAEDIAMEVRALSMEDFPPRLRMILIRICKAAAIRARKGGE